VPPSAPPLPEPSDPAAGNPGPRPPDPGSLIHPWTSVYPPGVPPQYRLPDVALPRFLDDAVRDFPHRSSLISDRDALDHVGVRDRAADLAEVLREVGVRPGDRVVLGLPNGASLPVALVAIWRVVAVAVPVPTEVGTDDLERIVDDAEPVLAIGTRRFVRHLPSDPARPQAVITIDDDGWLFPGRRRRLRARFGRRGGRQRPVPVVRGHAPAGVRAVPDVPAVAEVHAPAELNEVAEVRAPNPQASDLALLTYQLEEPDLPAVASTHASLVAAAFQARLWVPDIQAGTERILVAERLTDPTVLVLGLVMGWLAGASVICSADPDPPQLARLIARERPTLLVVGAGRVEGLIDDGDAARQDLTSLRVVLATGEDLPQHVVTDLQRRTGSGRIRSCFGLDAAPLTHAQPVYGRTVVGAMGLPVTSTVAAVVHPDHLDVLCDSGEPGRLLIHGPQVARGYWRRDAASAARFVDGWLVTDELATVDDEGRFRHLGALGEVVERGDTWVSPRRIEAVLLRQPSVRRAAVVVGGARHELLAAVVPAGRWGRPTEQELLGHCRAHLDSPAVPDRVILLDELPETDAGDLAHDELRELLAESGPS
jgi:long-chain acyl-CoA synthetase